MKLDTVEGYWASELGETVEILAIGWDEYPSEYSLLINGQACYTDRSLDGIERWLGVYSMVKGEGTPRNWSHTPTCRQARGDVTCECASSEGAWQSYWGR